MSNPKPRYLIAAAAFRIPNPLGSYLPLARRVAHNFILLLEEKENGEHEELAAFHGLSTRITQQDNEEKKEILAIGQFNDFLNAYCVIKPPELPHAHPSKEEIKLWLQAAWQKMHMPSAFYDINQDYEGSEYEVGYWLTALPEDRVILYGHQPGEDDALRLWNRLRMLRSRINARKLHYSAYGLGFKFFWEKPTNSNAIYTLATRLMELPTHEFKHLVKPGTGNSILSDNEINDWIQACQEKERLNNHEPCLREEISANPLEEISTLSSPSFST
jgi:hypothetical protein